MNIKFGGVEIPGGQFIVEVSEFINCTFMHASFKTPVYAQCSCVPTYFVCYMPLVNMMASPMLSNHGPTGLVSPG